jgi:LysR family transcriptional regulator, benzoate and cis,cis-muconate-responsive activator of ben and cat genes
MSLIQLKYFVAVAETGSVSRAARTCAVSQPPMTRQIHALEDELAARLFTRTSAGMRLTDEGQRLLPHAKTVLALVASTALVLRGE